MPPPLPADPRQVAARWLAEGRSARIVRVESTRGSTPREEGAAMVVAREGSAGTVGGGPVESQALAAARAALASGSTDRERLVVRLGPSTGALCGGAVTLLSVPLTPAELAAWPEPSPRFRLVLAGAGHVGQALVRVLAGVPCQVRWLDPRPDAFPGGPYPPGVLAVTVDGVDGLLAAAAEADPRDVAVVATYSAEVDIAVVRALLGAGVRFCGLVGSAAKARHITAQLAAEGVPAPALGRLACPVGLPGITGKDPAVLAIAVAAQLLSLPPDPRGADPPGEAPGIGTGRPARGDGMGP